MSKPIIYEWPAASENCICSTQSVVFATSNAVILNGSLSQPYKQGYVNGPHPAISLPGIARAISVTSGDDLTAATFTITGTGLNGAQIVDTVTGVNISTKETDLYFTSVSSVTVDRDVTNVSVGTGYTGQTLWFGHDPYVQVAATSVQVSVTGDITYSFTTTLNDVFKDDTVSYSDGIVMPFPGSGPSPWAYEIIMLNSSDSQFGCFTYPTRYSSISITASTTGSLVAGIMQQGICP